MHPGKGKQVRYAANAEIFLVLPGDFAFVAEEKRLCEGPSPRVFRHRAFDGRLAFRVKGRGDVFPHLRQFRARYYPYVNEGREI